MKKWVQRMNNLIASQTSQTATGTLAFAVGAVIAAVQPTWPEQETPNYQVMHIAPSYSEVSKQLTGSTGEISQADFAHDMATIYASLSSRQERLGAEFEAAIFDDLDSLYEA